MSMPNVVDRALDEYVRAMGARGVDPDGVLASTLAEMVGVPVARMGRALQGYRMRSGTRYSIACEGYGSMARWRILRKPSSDPQVVQQARLKHAIYLANDNLAKTVRDYAVEVFPALRGTELDQMIETVTRSLVKHLEVDVDAAILLLEAPA